MINYGKHKSKHLQNYRKIDICGQLDIALLIGLFAEITIKQLPTLREFLLVKKKLIRPYHKITIVSLKKITLQYLRHWFPKPFQIN